MSPSFFDCLIGFGLPIVGFGGCVIFIIWRCFKDSETTQNTIIASEVSSVDCYKQNGFTASKEIALDMPSMTQTQKFVVDDYSKRFGFYRYDSCGICNLQLWKYSDLLDFNLSEDGKQMIPGRGMMAAGGALLFGMKGAIIGSVAGDKAIQNICTEMSVQMKINDLNNPLISIGLLNGGYDKTSGFYRRAKEKADQIIATLTYIEANKNAEPVAPPSASTPKREEKKINQPSAPKPLDMKDFLS